MGFQAVVFDLFGTLVPAFPASRFQQSLAEMARAVGVAYQDFRRLWSETSALARVTGQFDSIEANVRYECAELGASPTDDQIAEAVRIRYAFTREVLRPRPDAVATLQRITSAGLGLALVSDCSAEVPEIWPETPFASLIDVPVFSCAAGTKKPDPRMYHLACDGLGVAPETCLYVGDGFSRELTGAAAVGMQSVLIAPPGEVSPDSSENEGDTWGGPRIEALSKVLDFLHLDQDA